jgi:hypothetical protein
VTEHEEKTMSIINLALLLSALARFIMAVAKLVGTCRSRK